MTTPNPEQAPDGASVRLTALLGGLSPLHLLAWIAYRQDKFDAGRPPLRWIVLDAAVQAKYLLRASEIHEVWRADELAAAEHFNDSPPNIPR